MATTLDLSCIIDTRCYTKFRCYNNHVDGPVSCRKDDEYKMLNLIMSTIPFDQYQYFLKTHTTLDEKSFSSFVSLSTGIAQI